MSLIAVSSLQEASKALKGNLGPIVAVPTYNAYEDVVQCLWALFRHTPSDTDIVIINDGSVEARMTRLVDNLREVTHRIVIWEHKENLGLVATANEAFRAAGRRDVVVLNSDVVVGPEWLQRLHEAAYSDARIATATPLTNNGTILSVPYRNTPSDLLPGFTPEGAAYAIAAFSYRLRPRIPTGIGHCLYIKRAAIDLVGEFDEIFSPGYGEEVDFSQRCHLAGLAHVCADDVFVYHKGGSSFGRSPEAQRLKEQHEKIIARRYPYYHPWVQRTANDTASDLATAIAAARRALLGLTVLVDATCLGPTGEMMEMQRNVRETIRALTRHPRINRVIAVLPPPGPPYLDEAFAECDKLKCVYEGQSHTVKGTDIAYRPFRVSSMQELRRLRQLGERVVIAQLDFIAFNNPRYFPDPAAWQEYRDLTRLTLAIADGVAFISRHAEEEARAEGLISPGKPTQVVYLGTDHCKLCIAPKPPALLPDHITHSGYVLCPGGDYRHKNRQFALRVFVEMCRLGYRGYLVFAGPRAPHGSSRPEEAEYLLVHRELEGRVLIFADVPEAEKEWLYGHASLILYPTLCEGFGLVPFEATAVGVPCLSSAAGSLKEVLPEGVAVISEWDPRTVAAQAIALIADGDRQRALVEALKRRGSDFTWDRVAERLIPLFEEVCRMPRSSVPAVEGEGGAISTAAVPLWFERWLSVPEFDNTYPPEFGKLIRAITRQPVLGQLIVRIGVLFYRSARKLSSAIGWLRRKT